MREAKSFLLTDEGQIFYMCSRHGEFPPHGHPEGLLIGQISDTKCLFQKVRFALGMHKIGILLQGHTDGHDEAPGTKLHGTTCTRPPQP